MQVYDAIILKPEIRVSESGIECPVRDCSVVVPRRKRKSVQLDAFFCPKHKIYISPTTFEYKDRNENLLWKAKTDNDLFKAICEKKRKVETFSHENSEDAVTWNVFRYLENQGLLHRYLSAIAGYLVEEPEIIYWSYCRSENDVWSNLQRARMVFEINPEKGSEPDLIIRSKNALFLIEAKLNATNETTPSSNNPHVQRKYESGANHWYKTVFSSDFGAVAIAKKKYELLRFWLLGSWIAHNLKVNFFLINLVPSKKEQSIEAVFKKHIKEEYSRGYQKRIFLRVTWESIYTFILDTRDQGCEKQVMLEYFRNKTVGYGSDGILQMAFSIE